MRWDDPETNARPLDEVLPRVLARGRSLRHRRRIVVRGVGSLAVVICLMGVAAAVAGPSGPDNHRVVRVADAPTTVAVPDDDTKTSSTSPVTEAPPSTTTTTTRPTAPTTSTTLYCHNSNNPACGPFRWVGDPGPNEPATDVVTWTPQVPTVGEDVIFTMTWDDPDAPILNHSRSLCIGDGSACVSGSHLAMCDRYGPWDLPARQPYHETQTIHHTFEKAGTFTLVNAFGTTSNDCATGSDPYGSEASFQGQITVEPAATTTTSTTR